MLLNLQVLDLLEISGSQIRAAESLAMHQSTVSRSYRELAEQFHLQPARKPHKVCRWGVSSSLRLLRLACRAHRLEDGRLRLASDALHQSLLERVPGVLQVPPCFHSAADWAALVRQGVIDGAIVSSLCHSQPLPAGRLPSWEGVRVVPLGALELQLVCHANWAGEWDETVLLPSAEVMPLLHQQLEPGVCGLLERSSRAWQEAPIWLEQLQLRPVALPVCPALAPRQWWQERGLMAVAEQPTMRERLWLLLPDDLELPHAAQATLRLIRRRVNRAAARGDEALLEAGRAAGLVELVGDGEAA
jgi:hypothetical protein